MEKFSSRVKALRLKANLSQKELAEMTGLSVRSIQYYELDTRKPKSLDTLEVLAKALNTTSEYLTGKSDVIVAEAYDRGGAKAARDVEEIVSDVNGLFAGGELDDEALDKIMKTLTEAYWIAKEKNKKYGRRKKKTPPADPEASGDEK